MTDIRWQMAERLADYIITLGAVVGCVLIYTGVIA